MILIADSGSSKTDCRIINNDGSISQATCAGMNPYYHDSDSILKELAEILKPQIDGEVQQVFYYGAGCSTAENCSKIAEAILRVFPTASIQINHDLLAAARSLCGQEEGIACILGTGANSCLYDGSDIVDNVAALGFILGDEGSGFYLGKQLMADYLRRNLPQNIADAMDEKYGLNKDAVLKKVYLKEGGSKYLASFSEFISENIGDPYLYRMVYHSFDEFFEKNVMKYENHANQNIHFTGSVAFYFSDILRQVGQDKGITIKNIIQSPIAGLTLYHQS